METAQQEDSNLETLEQTSKIDWEDLNFPPGLRLIHFDLRELQGDVRRFSQRCYWTWISLMVFYVFNIGTNIVEVLFEHGHWARICMSVLHFFIMTLICFYVFYQGYMACSFDNSQFRTYILLEMPLALFYLYVFYYDTSCYNGIEKMIKMVEAKYYTTAIFVGIEDFFLFISIFMRLSCLYRAFTWKSDLDEKTEAA